MHAADAGPVFPGSLLGFAMPAGVIAAWNGQMPDAAEDVLLFEALEPGGLATRTR
jgi:hypothetical protein